MELLLGIAALILMIVGIAVIGVVVTVTIVVIGSLVEEWAARRRDAR